MALPSTSWNQRYAFNARWPRLRRRHPPPRPSIPRRNPRFVGSLFHDVPHRYPSQAALCSQLDPKLTMRPLSSASAQTRTFRLAIRAPSNGHSLSAIFPVSPSPIGHFGKEQSGTDFGQAKPLGVRQRDRGGRFPPDVSLRDSVVSYTSLQTRLVPQKPRHTIRPKLSIFATRQCRLRAVTSILKAGVTAGHMPGR